MGIPAKPVTNKTPSVVKKTPSQQKVAQQKVASHSPSSVKKIKAPTQTLPYLYGNALFYWKTPAIDQKFRHNLYYKIYNDGLRYNRSEQIKLSFPYFNSLVQALSKRNPEKDAKAFLAKKQRFLLAGGQGGEINLLNRGNLQIAYHVSNDTVKRCIRPGIKYLQGMTRTQRECYMRGSSTCTQLSRIVEKYIYRWNKVMLKDCKKH
ncbi:MAG: hypothetical protein DSZ21_01725 [Tenericutes bacterium]|nr:MAG: hypothetical protein DSZ21_01725 [Mycoplasmatota bacterium]